ncbi:MAG TPA: aspartate/glutamate racemase family protein [Candidatus Avacidaminococcus intestinavium]|uniref:Aspartate/glutamate racemase family protein n=1 Tax=Candidatus Avacidaminococcus intestinavium TaxID=2840684 RepID=A0A9D1MR31_9FIRM|nr:aspartate/glutamate racemase family protein [Candidatus Avacidaminococcus intestinavium]
MKDGYIKTNKVLGVLGGMGPAATAEFLRILTELSPAENDGEHPIVHMISAVDIPDRSTAIMGKGPDPSFMIEQYLAKLVNNGADILAAPCNTVHYFIDRLQNPPVQPLVHIVKESLYEAQRLEPNGAWLFSTEGTKKSGLYQEYAKANSYHFYEPDIEQVSEIQTVINLVKGNRLKESGVLMKRVVETVWEKNDLPIMMACTELPLAYMASGLAKERGVSSLEALAKGCLRHLYKK